MKNLHDILGSLCETLRDNKLKSKQAAFNLFLNEIIEAKEVYSLEQICDYINKNADLKLSSETYRTMIDRAKRKHKFKKGEPAPLTKPIEHKGETDKNLIKKSGNISSDDYRDYMNVCFNKERIVQQAVENNVSVETIRSWGCANFVQVSNALGNYIRNKR